MSIPLLAAGVVIVRRGLDGPEVAVIHRPRRRDWSLPKGKLDPGEHLIAAAVRECVEETGFKVSLGMPLTSQSYRVMGRTKRVNYWLATINSGRFTPNDEVDALIWIPAEAASKLLTYTRDAALVDEALNAPQTVPLVLLRHTAAMKRAEWRERGGGTRNDPRRPLNNQGRREAAALVDLLAAYGVERVHTSPSERCSATVRPFAAAHRLAVHEEQVLSEEGHEEDPEESRNRFLDLLEEPEPMVVCSHRPVLPDLQAILTKYGAVLTSDGKTITDRGLTPGGFIVAHRTVDERGHVTGVAALEWHEPPQA